jgi:hypothetical protein
MATPSPTSLAPLTRLNKWGLGLATLLGVVDLVGVAMPTPDGEEGPPYAILLISGVLGLITVVCVVIAWRSQNRAAIRLVAGARILSAITSLPAFFVDVPAGVKVLVGVGVLLTVAVVVMVLTPARRSDMADLVAS